MPGLVFQESAPPIVSAPSRADIACFVGFVARKRDRQGQFLSLPDNLARWLAENGWTAGPYALPAPEALLNVPVPIESWAAFDALFDWQSRPVRVPQPTPTTHEDEFVVGGSDAPATVSTYFGAALRSFFAQGGRKCYVVRVGDPWPLSAGEMEREAAIAALIPGWPNSLDGHPADRANWRGVCHLFGLPDVGLLCLPDLPDAVRGVQLVAETAITRPDPPEQWVECSTTEAPAPDPDHAARWIEAPRSDAAGYEQWARAVRMVADTLARWAREVQFVAALPLPTSAHNASGGITTGTAETMETGANLFDALTRTRGGPLAYPIQASLTGIASAFVQLAYPWARTPGSLDLPEQLESPDGILTGTLARSALARGAFRSVAGQSLGDVYDVFPMLRTDEMATPRPDTPEEKAASHTFLERVSLLGRAPEGWRLLSDVTTSLDEGYRLAGVNRLTCSLLRAARRCGEDITFEPSGEQVWAEVRERMAGLLEGLLARGALRGGTANEAYRVRCDRSTMTPQDIDSGRVIAEVAFQPAAPIEQITITLALNGSGSVTRQ